MALRFNHKKTLTDGSTITINHAQGYNVTKVTIGGDRSLNITNSNDGDEGMLIVYQDSTGGRTLSYNGEEIALNPGPGQYTIVGWINDSGNILFASSIGGTSGAILTQLSTPGSFTATQASSSQINLSWSDVANDSGYKIYRGTTSSFGSASLIHTTSAGATSYNNTGLAAATTYYYWIIAAGDGVTYSDSSSATSSATTAAGAASIAGTTWYSKINPAAGVTTTTVGSDQVVTKVVDQAHIGNTFFDLYPSGTGPLLKTLNGQSVFEFDSAAKNLGSSNWSSPGALNKPLTRIAAIKVLSAPPTDTGRYIMYTTSAANDLNVAIYNDGGTMKLAFYSGGVLSYTAIPGDIVVNGVYVVCIETDGSGGDKIYLNNVLKSTGNGGSHSSMPGCVLGGTASDTANVQMGYHLVYNGIFSSDDRTAIYNELATLYGI